MTWVLLRGLSREARHWGGFTSQFASQGATGNVVALDLPGNGEFYRQNSPATVSAMVESARQQLLAKSYQPPYKLLAMSLGAMVATDWAQRYPLEVDGLVHINTSMKPYSRITERMRPANWPTLGLLALRWADTDHVERTIHQLTCNLAKRRAEDLAQWSQIRKTAPVSSQNALRQLLAAARFTCANAAPSCPVLVLSSCADRLVNPVCSSQLAQAWKAEHHSHLWAGHDLPHDDGEWVCERVKRWSGSK